MRICNIVFCASAVVLLIVWAERPAQAAGWTQEAKLLADDAERGDTLGVCVGLSGSTAIVGAPGRDDNGVTSGAAYIFRKSGSGWQQTAKLIPADNVEYDHIGAGVDVFGSKAILGAYGDGDRGEMAGAAYIFEDNGSGWQEVAKLTASDGAAWDYFGQSVALSGSRAIVGSWRDDERTGSAYVYEDTGVGWTQVAKLTASDGAAYDEFGQSVAIDGSRALVGAYHADAGAQDTGAAYLFEDAGSGWQQVAKWTNSDAVAFDNFGRSVDLDGSTAIVGAYGDDDFGHLSGAAYIFRDTGSGWEEVAKLTASDGAAYDYFGKSVALSGSMAVIGAEGDDDNGEDSGSAYVFQDTGAGWVEIAKLLPADSKVDDYFAWGGYGAGVDISGSTVIVGNHSDDENGPAAGAAYIFTPEPATLALLAVGRLLLIRRRAR